MTSIPSIHASFDIVAPLSPSSRCRATPAPASAAPELAGAVQHLSGLKASTDDENHPESIYEACHANYAGDDLHAVPEFPRTGESRFPSGTRR